MRDIVGADDVLAGRRKTARGSRRPREHARRPLRRARLRTSSPGRRMPFFCAVPPTAALDAEGIGAFPSAGPYYVQDTAPGERVVIRRNPYYGGARAVHLEGFDVDLRGGTPQDMIRRDRPRARPTGGTLPPPSSSTPRSGFVAKYGINKSRFFVQARA